MQGKTKSFFEDVLVLVTLAAIGWGGYTFFFIEDDIPLTNNTPTIVKSQVQEQHKKPQEQEQSPTTNENAIEIVKTENLTVLPIDQKLANPLQPSKEVETIILEIDKNKEIIHSEDEVFTQVVDIQKIQEFLIETKKKIKKTIVVNNQKKETLSIRITVLKDGSFEQLITTGGNTEIFKNNYQNIAKIFPLQIAENIAGDFPRYLRYNFEFSLKDE